MEKLVSIITPCFNGELYLHRFLNSILAQSYSNIELILIDDGSTDKTAAIIEEYNNKFENKGYTIIYIYQENQGQAAAINKGLKIFKGDYLTWPDSDDLLYKDSVKNKVKFLSNHPNYDFVRTDVSIVNERDISKTINKASDTINFKNENIFDDLLCESNVYFCPGGYMVTRSALMHVKPDFNIYESRAGQNWQLLLPISLLYKCGYLNECLYKYVIRDDSHSHSVKDFEKEVSRCDEHEQLLLKVLSELDIEQQSYKNLILKKYHKKRFKISCLYGQKEKAIYFYKSIQNKDFIEFISFISIRLNLYNLIRRVNSFAKSVVKIIRN